MNSQHDWDALAHEVDTVLQPESVEPQGDLWPQVRASIERRRRARVRRRIGAAAIVVATGVAGWSALQPLRPAPMQALVPEPTTVALAQVTESPDLDQLRTDLARMVVREDLPASARNAIADALLTLERERAALEDATATAPNDLTLARWRSEHEAREATVLARLHRLTRSV
jgi:hypothetical protein